MTRTVGLSLSRVTGSYPMSKPPPQTHVVTCRLNRYHQLPWDGPSPNAVEQTLGVGRWKRSLGDGLRVQFAATVEERRGGASHGGAAGSCAEAAIGKGCAGF